jgi:acetylornithine deacetylase/succinyl-diaminopimelate desuccinylase-like protein
LLLALLSLLLARPVPAAWPFGDDGLPDPAEDLGAAAAALLSRAIRFDTTNPPGNEAPLARFLVQVLERQGVEARVVESPGDEGTDRALVWARHPGRGGARPIVLLSHLDVVPAEPAEWGVAPFEGVAGGGYVVGRGALDAKGVAVVHLLTLVELKRRGLELDRDVILLATPDEETGGSAGAGWIVRQRAELLRDAEYLLTEGGGILPSPSGGPDIWGVSYLEKSPCWLELVARGTPGHGSAASRDAAVPQLVAALERVRNFESEVRVIPEVERMFRELAPLAPAEDQLPLAHLELALEIDPEFRARFLADPGRNALVRNSFAITVLRAGSRTNVVPAEARAQIDARLLPGESCADFAARIAEVIDDPGIGIDPLLSFPARASRLDTPLLEAMARVAAASRPRGLLVPRVLGGFSDAHWFRDSGIAAYGFVPRRLHPEETRGVHGPNERISVENLVQGVEITLRILEEFAGGAERSGP